MTTWGFLDEGVGIAKVAILTSPGPRVTVDCIHAITKVPSCFSLSTPTHCSNPRSCMGRLARMRVQVEAAWRHRCGSTTDNLACRARSFLSSSCPPTRVRTERWHRRERSEPAEGPSATGAMPPVSTRRRKQPTRQAMAVAASPFSSRLFLPLSHRNGRVQDLG